MNECACNSMSPRNGKYSLLYRSYRFLSGGEYGSGDPGSGCIVDGRRNHSFFWLFLAAAVRLMIMEGRSTYLLANRAITINEEDHLTLESDW